MTADRIIDEIMKLSFAERSSLISRLRTIIDNNELQESANRRCDALIPIAEEVVGHEVNVDRRTSLDVLVRQLVAFRMHKEDFTLNSIGRAMYRTHAAIYRMCTKMKDYFSLPRIYAYELQKYAEFEKRVKELDKQTKK